MHVNVLSFMHIRKVCSWKWKLFNSIMYFTPYDPCIALYLCNKSGPGSLIGIATELRAGRSGDRIPVGWEFPPVQTEPGAHPASCTMGTGSFKGVNYNRSVLLTTHPLLVPRSMKSRAIPLLSLWATTGPVTGTLYHFTYVIRTNKMHTLYINVSVLLFVFDMFRKSKCSSSGGYLHAVLWYFFHASI
jgi:hypothetical protein